MFMPASGNSFDGLLLGWEKMPLSNQFGFRNPPSNDKRRQKPADADASPVLYDGNSHLMTFAPTGAGKGRGMIIPTLLRYPGSVVVIDPKGENYAVTANQRRKMGQKVVLLDPFKRATRGKNDGDRFNVFDIFKLPNTIVDADASMLAWQLAAGHSFSKDAFWDNTAAAFMFGLICHVATAFEDSERNLNRVLKYLYSDDVVYGLAVLLDSKTVKCPQAYREISAFLQLPDRDTRPSVLATALSWVKSLNMQCVEETLESSTFDLQDLLYGNPISIYLCIPPDKLLSHRSLLRMWIAALMTTVLRREKCPDQQTLFILDECAQLGTMPMLEQAVTLLRGYGLQVWTFWQDMEQVRANYPNRHETLINNAAVLQTFGISNRRMAQQLTEVLDCPAAELMAMKRDELRVCIHGQGSLTCRLPDYLNDAAFNGLWDDNPYFGNYRPIGAACGQDCSGSGKGSAPIALSEG